MQLRVNGFGTPLCVEASQMFDDFASHAVAIQSLTYCKNAGAHGVEVALDIHSYRNKYAGFTSTCLFRFYN